MTTTAHDAATIARLPRARRSEIAHRNTASDHAITAIAKTMKVTKKQDERHYAVAGRFLRKMPADTSVTTSPTGNGSMKVMATSIAGFFNMAFI